MNQSTLDAQVLPRLLAGSSRMPLRFDSLLSPGDEKAGLKTLAFAGQALRFNRPVSPPRFADQRPIDDDRTIIPDVLRRPLLRLLAMKPQTKNPELVLANTFDHLRLRPHPFDLPKLEAFVRDHADKLGTTAQQWSQRQRQLAWDKSFFDIEALDDTNWMHGTLKRRIEYLQQRRSMDPTAGRALLEAEWDQRRHALPARMLQTMLTGLGPADRPFLETIAKENLLAVSPTAGQLLGRLNGTFENPALTTCLAQIKRTETGFLRKRPELALEIPATIAMSMTWTWICRSFDGVRFAELAKALAIDEPDLIAASAKDENMLLALTRMACAEGRLDLLQSIVDDHLPKAWYLLIAGSFKELAVMSTADRLRWAGILAHPHGDNLPPSRGDWNWLYALLEAPAPEALWNKMMEKKWLDSLTALEERGPAWMEIFAAFCPPAHYAALLTRLHAFDPAMTSIAIPLVEILQAMHLNSPQKVNPHA